MFVLTYDATLWANDETTDSITLLDGTPITVAVNEYISPARVQPVGVLGVYSTEAKARRVGKAWLYDHLTGLGENVHMPLPIQDGNILSEPDWRKSLWRRLADGSLGYSISDYSRMVALIVHVTEKDVVLDDGGDDDDDDDDVADDDGDYGYVEEYGNSDDDAGEQVYRLVGPLGRRRRVLNTSEDDDEEDGEEAEGEEEEYFDANEVVDTAEEEEGENVEG